MFRSWIKTSNAQHRAGDGGINALSLIAGQFIKWLFAEMVGGEYLMNVKLHSNGSQKSDLTSH